MEFKMEFISLHCKKSSTAAILHFVCVFYFWEAAGSKEVAVKLPPVMQMWGKWQGGGNKLSFPRQQLRGLSRADVCGGSGWGCALSAPSSPQLSS